MINETNRSTSTSNSTRKRSSKESSALEEPTMSKKKKQCRVTAVQMRCQMEGIGAERLHCERAYHAIIEKVRAAQSLCNGKVLIAPIVKTVNTMYNTEWKADTIRRRIRDGTECVVPRKGPRRQLHESIENALIEAIISFINLVCSEMDVQPRRKIIIII